MTVQSAPATLAARAPRHQTSEAARLGPEATLPKEASTHQTPPQAALGPEAALIEAIQNGEYRAALSLCVRHHGEAIGRYCMALVGTQSEAEDLTQETLLAAFHAFGQWRGEATLKAWLYAIARRKCARHLERRSRQTAQLRAIPTPPAEPSADEVALRLERAARTREALNHVRPSDREVLVLRFQNSLTYHEVGQICGVDEAAARKRVSRALRKLRDALTDKE